ncbi:MAG: sortase B protein-sorting domain-containing protein [Faecalimonas umbilicata]|uniref:sortase B protein-sorting domain-containing protein n=1 Tax=Faecalimonas umbilicata TaxID=1912855 RepID=UPI001E07782C|nr:sortase B protein-sorting domain-containing protein [Faecalimonas umbilicata]MBS5763682.1 sortase B protein-sorting domain-containing protein [Lachnospiraceae bacterium]MCI5985190.1 sortase B protein-sorting domain-containing protein [Faecalimonas umbilicata]MDY5092710.1 sortase B protein-sorting domain-containing protein [Faecalimonas umbilicata]
MKTIKKWMAYFVVVLMLCSMSQVRVLAEDALPTADTPKITEFKIQGVKGTVDDQQQKINVEGLPCNTDLTSLTAEVTCDPADAIVRFDPLKPSADDGQKKLEQGNALQTEDFSVPRICNVEYQGQINSYTVTVSTLSHAGDPATCTNDSVCKTCGMLLEEKWGHDLLAATCTEKAKCQRSGCSYTEPALGHDLSKATCTEPARCQREGCDYTEGEALGHDLSKATCAEPARCQREGCDYTEGEALGHDLSKATCTEPARCQKEGCDYTEGKALGHDLSKATCTEAAKCQREGCDYTEGEALGHDLSKATCTEPARCRREGCDYTEGKALGHDLSKATCTEAAKCQREGCDYTEGKPLGHEMNAWTVTKKSTTTEKGEQARNCKRCDYRETELIERLSRKADAGKNQIADLRTDINYPLDETITFHLYGAGQDNTEPVDGDTRYVPESWKIENQFDWRETDGESGFQIHKAGFYKVMASFRQQKFESGTWQNTDQTDIKEVTIKAGTEAQREEQARKDAAKKAAKTGDTSQMFVYILLLLVAAGLAVFVIVRNKKKQQ